MSIIHNQLRGVKRSDLNNDQWKISDQDKKEVLIEFITYGIRRLNQDMSLDEFVCSSLAYYHDDFHNRTTTALCEGKAFGRGCSDIKGCVAYDEQKKLQSMFPGIDWSNPIDDKTEEFIKASLIKKGCIRPEVKVEESKAEEAN